MIGLFQENGPCRISNDSQSLLNNPYSWNEYANMLYIDQPIGVGKSTAHFMFSRRSFLPRNTLGYSYGDQTVTGTDDAAKAVYQLLQIFFADPKFSKYQRDDFALWTESYGGHYGPTFSAYFESQNALVDAGQGQGLLKINLKTLGIGNGLTVSIRAFRIDLLMIKRPFDIIGSSRAVPAVCQLRVEQQMYVPLCRLASAFLTIHIIS